jgi:hypothetical protein
MYEKIYIYLHICCITTWKEVVDGLLNDIKESGLYDKVYEIRCYVLSENIYTDLKYFIDGKIRIIGVSEDLKLYEVVTINSLRKDAIADTNNAYVLYLHSKGVTKPDNLGVKDWVKYMCYFNIYKYEECISKLKEGFNAVGVNLIHSPKTHFSGNFWWSSFNHIRNLEECGYSYYIEPEMWICTHSQNFISLFNSNKCHYIDRYDETLYKINI